MVAFQHEELLKPRQVLLGSTLFRLRLPVNINKSDFIIIGSKREVDDISDINIDINNDYCLNKCDKTKLLGGMIDSYLSWQPHVEYLYSKIVSKIGLLHRLRQTVTSDILNIIYLSIIQPYCDYCITLLFKNSEYVQFKNMDRWTGPIKPV